MSDIENKFDNRYRLSQNYMISWNKGNVYITNPTDIYNLNNIEFPIDKISMLFDFIKYSNPSDSINKFNTKEQSGIAELIKELISKKVLITYDQQEDINLSITNMLQTLRKINSDKQKEYAIEKINSIGTENEFLTEKEAKIKNKKIISMLVGVGLEIGGNVPFISEELVGNNILLKKLDFDPKKDDTINRDATDLSNFENNTIDFIISSHTLEHLSNPIKALKEWIRVVKNNGLIYLVLPNRDYTNDHNRPLTTLEHLKQDYTSDMILKDFTHVQEIKNCAEWWCMENFMPLESPYVHMHTWNMKSLLELLNYLGFTVVDFWMTKPFHLHTLLKFGEDNDNNKVEVTIIKKSMTEIMAYKIQRYKIISKKVFHNGAKILPYFIYNYLKKRKF